MADAARPPTKKEPISPPLALRRAHDWSEAALFQGRRLTELLDYHLSFDRRNAMPAEWRAFKAANVLPGGAHVETLEGYLFLVALHRVSLTLPLLLRPKVAKEVASAAKMATASLPKAAELKKLLDDPHEGLLGGGKGADFYDASSNAVAHTASPNDYVIGGRVSLPRSIAALQRLTPVLAAARRT